MRTKLTALLLLLCLNQFTAANEGPEKPIPQQTSKLRLTLNGTTYIQEEAPTLEMPLNQHILFVFDCSGSMNPASIQEALDFVTAISSQPTDSMEIAVLAFDAPNFDEGGKLVGGLYRWPGIPEPDMNPPVPPSWAGLPSLIAVQQMARWISNTRSEHGGGTNVIPAIKRAIAEARDELSIIIVSDGQFNEGDNEVRKALATALKTRLDNKKLDHASIMVYGVGGRTNILAEIAKAGGGGYYRKAPPPPAPIIPKVPFVPPVPDKKP